MASIPSSPDIALTPTTPRQLADLLGETAVRGGAVMPVGGGSKLRFGNPLSRQADAVSTKGLNRILSYEPDDMTISIEAGATIGEVWRELATRGQTIPIDVPSPDIETIGGLIATGLCGPRRFGSGSLRDALIGIQVAYPDATLGNAGGMVVKNVSGFDLMRMHLGALGTLGVIVSANFKVVPAARAEATVLLSRHSVDALESDRQAITRSRIRPIAFEVRQVDGAWQVAVRIEGRPATVDQMARELADSFGEATTLSTEQSAEFWQTYVAGEILPASGDALVLQVRGKPSDTFKTLLATENAFQKTCLTLEEVRVAPGLGTVRYSVRVPETSAAEAGAAIKELRASERSVLVLTAPGWVQRTIDAFGLPDSTLELMRQLKRQFDPRSVLNPGRVIPEL